MSNYLTFTHQTYESEKGRRCKILLSGEEVYEQFFPKIRYIEASDDDIVRWTEQEFARRLNLVIDPPILIQKDLILYD